MRRPAKRDWPRPRVSCETISLRPEYPEPYYNLGTALLAQKRYDEAEAALKTFMTLSPARDVGPERLGLLYLVQARYAEALPLLRQAARMRGSGFPPPAAAEAQLKRVSGVSRKRPRPSASCAPAA